MKLSDWARSNGIKYLTAYRWFRDGNLPVPAIQTKTGTILVTPPTVTSDKKNYVVYCRVSSGDQKNDLERQVARVVREVGARGFLVSRVVTEIGSGLNGHRKQIKKLLEATDYNGIAVEHRDRLARFGSEYIEAAMKSAGKDLLVVDAAELKDDLVQDMIDVMTSFCARLYGRRAAKNKAMKAVKVITDVG